MEKGKNESNGVTCCSYWDLLQKETCLSDKEKDDLFLVNNLFIILPPHRDFVSEIQKMAQSGNCTECDAKKLLKEAIPQKKSQNNGDTNKTICYVVHLYLKLFRSVEQMTESGGVWAGGNGFLSNEEAETFRSKNTTRKGECVGGFFPHD